MTSASASRCHGGSRRMASRHGHDGRVTADDRNVAETRSRIAGRIVARQRELELILAAVAAGRDILLEGPLAPPKAPCCEPSLSDSMRGERAQTAAAAAGALVAELASDDFGVVAFWSDAVMLADLGQHRSTTGLVDAHLRIPARGLTNLSFPLRVVGRQLRRIPTTTPGRGCFLTASTTPASRSSWCCRPPALPGRLARYFGRARRRPGP